MHYTSIENIHKVIDPLFLDDLKAELAEIKAEPVDKTRNKKLRAYQEKLASLKWLDPCAGSGNFLTKTHLCVRRLENEVISDLHKGQIKMAFEEIPNPIKVSINQFYGIEIRFRMRHGTDSDVDRRGEDDEGNGISRQPRL